MAIDYKQLSAHLPEGDFKALAESIANHTGHDVTTVAMIGLGVASQTIMRKYRASYEHGGHLALGEMIIATGEPGDGKSRILSLWQTPVNEAQEAANKVYKDEAKQAALIDGHDEKKWKKEHPAPLNVRPISDATPEAIEAYLQASGGMFAIASAEQAAVNTLLGKSYKDKGSKANKDLILKGFAGEYHSSARVTRDGYSGFVAGSLVAFAQHSMASTILSDDDDSGLIERCLFIQSPKILGTRKFGRSIYPSIDALTYGRYCDVISDITSEVIEHPREFCDLIDLGVSPNGWDSIYAYRNRLETELADGGKYATGNVRGMAAKVDMHILKLASILHIVEGNKDVIIRDKYVTACIYLMDCYLSGFVTKTTIEHELSGLEAQKTHMMQYLSRKRAMTESQFYRDNQKVKIWAGHKYGLDKEPIKAAIKHTIDALLADGVIAIDQRIMPDGSAVIRQYILAN